MKNKIKKLFCAVICIAVLFIFIVPVHGFEIGKDDIYIENLPGDINSDGKVNAEDARICLRAAAMLDNLTDEQKKAADVFGTGEINSACARKILRVAAKLENMNIIVKLNVGQKLIVKPRNGAQTLTWKCEADNPSDLIINYFTEDNTQPGTIGGLYDQFFVIQASTANTYTLHFKHVVAWNDVIHNEYYITVIVS